MAKTSTFAIFLTLALAACGGQTTSGNASGGGRSDIDAGTEEERAQACKRAFAVDHSARCGGPTMPADELARASALFEQDCMNQFALRGNGVTAAALEACATATEAAACQTPDGPPAECTLDGTLPGGAACSVGTQCESGFCKMSGGVVSPGGGGSPATCGHCGPIVRVGEPCPQGSPQGGCPGGSLCITPTPDAPAPSFSCVARTFGGEGASCDGLAAICQRGLYCEGQSKRCTPLAELGQPCGSQWATGCKPPLFCTDAPGTCKVPGETGAPCQQDVECASGLACAYQQQQCGPVTWVAPGDICDDTHRCLRGSCYPGGPFDPDVPRHCPLIVPDGAPCFPKNQDSCEETSICFDGTCRPVHSIRCE